MIYVVSGTVRSGTSMMMKCLHKGGLDSYYSRKQERMLREQFSLARNPGGYWEPDPQEKYELDWPIKANRHAIKILAPWRWLPVMARLCYRVIIMTRDPKEIELSIKKINNGIVPAKDRHILKNYDKFMQKGIQLAENRKDIQSVFILPFQEVLDYPGMVFKKLEVRGWPIDPAKAASVVNPKLKTVNV